jgi:hypothetical protein
VREAFFSPVYPPVQFRNCNLTSILQSLVCYVLDSKILFFFYFLE